MKSQQLISALPVLNKLMELKLPIKKAYALYSLAKQVNEYREFFINEEKKRVTIFNIQVAENGDLHFNSQEDQLKFIQEHNELMSYEMEDIKCVDLLFTDLGDLEITPIELGLLDGIINFVE